MATTQPQPDIIIRPLAETEVADASRIVRVAFATFLGVAPDDPRRPSDSDYVRSRWTADRDAVVAAEDAGKLIGTNFATHWGSFGFFGPLTVEPEYWNRGVGQMLLAPTMEIFRRWGSRHLGLFTFPHSPKHMVAVPEIRFLAAGSGRHHGQGNAAGTRRTFSGRGIRNHASLGSQERRYRIHHRRVPRSDEFDF